MKRKYKVVIVDKEKVRWVFEGKINGIQIYVKEGEARPKMLTLTEAREEFDQQKISEDVVIITE